MDIILYLIFIILPLKGMDIMLYLIFTILPLKEWIFTINININPEMINQ